MTTTKLYLQRKGNKIWSTRPDATVFEALQLMAEKDIGALLVFDSGGLVGIFSERDYARKVILQGKSSRETLVRDIMTPQVICVRPENTIEECMAVMTEKRIRHLPVMDAGQVLGVISIGDAVKSIISEQEFVIEQLTNYITGNTLHDYRDKSPR
jgi:CBS domain-containing protein